LVTPTCANLLEGHSQLNEVIHFERRRLAHSWWNPFAAADLFGLTRDLQRRQFDLVVDLQGLFRSGWLTRATGAAVRVGFTNAREFAWLGYTHRVPIETDEQHAIERYLTVSEALGCGRGPVEFHFATTDADRKVARELVADQGSYAVILPGANWATKRWPIENFAALVKPLRDEFGLVTVVAGARDTIDLATKIPGALAVTGGTTLRQLTALLEGARLVIANDSGPMHVAAALGKPLVAIFGPTNPVRTGPFGREECVIRMDIPCSPCYSRKCSHQSCLKWLTVENVLALVRDQLARKPITTRSQAAPAIR
jgi:lipopolysaccharide heptosyltransferase II